MFFIKKLTLVIFKLTAHFLDEVDVVLLINFDLMLQLNYLSVSFFEYGGYG